MGKQIFGAKWRNWKMVTKEIDEGLAPTREYGVPRIYNLNLDPKEEHPLNYMIANTWVRWPLGRVLAEHAQSLRREPPIPSGAPDPYRPGRH